MSSGKCPECGHIVARSADSCPNCGNRNFDIKVFSSGRRIDHRDSDITKKSIECEERTEKEKWAQERQDEQRQEDSRRRQELELEKAKQERERVEKAEKIGQNTGAVIGATLGVGGCFAFESLGTLRILGLLLPLIGFYAGNIFGSSIGRSVAEGGKNIYTVKS